MFCFQFFTSTDPATAEVFGPVISRRCYRPPQRVGQQHGVGVKRRRQRSAQRCESGVERVGLAVMGNRHHRDMLVRVPLCVFAYDRPSVVGRTVVDHDGADLSGIGLSGQRAQRADQRFLLVVGGDQYRNRREVEILRFAQARRPVEQQRHKQLHVQVARNHRDALDYDDRQRQRDLLAEVGDPETREVQRQQAPQNAEDHGDHGPCAST